MAQEATHVITDHSFVVLGCLWVFFFLYCSRTFYYLNLCAITFKSIIYTNVVGIGFKSMKYTDEWISGTGPFLKQYNCPLCIFIFHCILRSWRRYLVVAKVGKEQIY